MVRSALVKGSRSIAWNASSLSFSTAESAPSSWTLMLVLSKAAHWGGRSPTCVGWIPVSSTRHGTSTTQPPGRLEMSPVFLTLTFTLRGVPVSMLWMM